MSLVGSRTGLRRLGIKQFTGQASDRDISLALAAAVCAWSDGMFRAAPYPKGGVMSSAMPGVNGVEAEDLPLDPSFPLRDDAWTSCIQSDDALAKLRNMFTKESDVEPVRGTALLPGSVCYCFQDVRKDKEVDQPQMQSVVYPGRMFVPVHVSSITCTAAQPEMQVFSAPRLLPPDSDHQGSHRFCLVGGLPPLPKKVYRVRWSSLCPIDDGGAVREDIPHFRHYRILWRRPGHDEDELVELLPPSDGMCQIAAVDGVHVVNPDEITWNRSMPKRCD
eukprot:Skav232232  [mRNA]  locus=scaffold4367:78192:91582:- [translate_table: standard]